MTSSPPSSPSTPLPPLIDISRPRTDQSTYIGRVRHFLDVIDPTTLFVTEKQLNQSLSILDRYKKGLLRDIDEQELWKAKKIKDAVVHPDTGEVIFWPCRWSAFVPINVPIVVGMLNSSTVYGNIFWQWANQSYNVAVNYANRNASNTMSMEQIGSAYAGAVIASCSIAIGLGRVVQNISSASVTGRILKLAIPFLAVSSAGSLNVYLMRRNEMSEGIAVQDHEGNTLGKSQTAGRQAIIETAATRVALPAPILLFPPIVMSMWDRTSIAKNYPKIRTPMNVAVITGCLWAALPAAIGLFQQTSELDVSAMEPQFRGLKDSQGKPITKVYFNKGL